MSNIEYYIAAGRTSAAAITILVCSSETISINDGYKHSVMKRYSQFDQIYP